jgi:two-component system, NarL family, sensor histidine kinase DesK
MPAFLLRRRAAADSDPEPAAAPRPPAPAGTRLSVVDEPDTDWIAAGRIPRLLVFAAIIAAFVVIPAVTHVVRHPAPSTIFMVVGTITFVGMLAVLFLTTREPGGYPAPWAWLITLVALAITLYVVGGGEPWLVLLAVAAGVCGRFSATIKPAAFGAISCMSAGLAMAIDLHYKTGDIATVLIMPPLAAFFAYTAGKRNETVATLRQTRAELARIAVSEERLRIARDLHDLLGHSLSLIALKAELSRRMIGTDAERAEREIAELESVARQSLRDVREAVAGYRQPDLASELAAARQLLTAAGVACRIESPAELGIPGEVDAVLAWTVREGITNVVRHAAARSALITVSSSGSAAIAEISDDGADVPEPAQSPAHQPEMAQPEMAQPAASQADATRPTPASSAAAGPPRVPRVAPRPAAPATEPTADLARPDLPRLRRTGSGLAGLAERVRELGGDLAAGHVEPRGFCLRVTIPLDSQES